MSLSLHARALRRGPSTLLVAALAFVLASCGMTQVNNVTGERQRGAYSWQQEVELGTQADQQVQAQYGLYDDAALAAYVDRVGQDVLQNSSYANPGTPAEIRNTPFYFRVLDSDVVNAFALPGGYTYVTRGLLAHLENEAQLAMVLGHEIGHVLGRHSSERAAQAQLGQFGVLAGTILGGVLGGGQVAQGILQYGSQGAGLLLLKYGRDQERESDEAGVDWAEAAGYDASEAAGFFRSLQRLGEQSGAGGVPNFLSTHPAPGERQETIPQLAAQASPQGTAVREREYMDQIDGIVLGEDPRQGFTEGNRFYHPELAFQFSFPQGWETVNTASFVQVSDGRTGLLRLELSQASSASAAVRELAGQEGVQVGNQRSTRVNGLPAQQFAFRIQSQQSTLDGIGYFIEYGGRVYQWLAAVPGGQNPSALDRYLQSFAPLTDRSYLNRQPTRLDVERLSSSRTIAQALSGRSLPAGMTPEELAILNQVTLGERLPAGTLIKLPSN